MPLALLFIFTFIILLTVELAYIPLAKRNGWSTERNRRADGHPVTVVGGGIIFYIAMVIWSLAMGAIYHQSEIGANFIVGLTMLAACSFADDVLLLKVWIRLVVQFVAVLFLGFQCSVFMQPLILWPAFLICTVAFINAYNFMDGINGITAAYSVSVLGFFLYINTYVLHFISGSLIIMALISLFIFAFFNYRKRALAFAGDVGSITMGYIVAAVLIYYILETHSLTAVILVSVYGVDTLLTVVRRAAEGENILLPHRKHIYQLLCHVWRFSQLKVATGYAVLQLAISIGYLNCVSRIDRILYCIAVAGVLSVAYFIIMIASENKRRSLELHRNKNLRQSYPRRRRNRSKKGPQKSTTEKSTMTTRPLSKEYWN